MAQQGGAALEAGGVVPEDVGEGERAEGAAAGEVADAGAGGAGAGGAAGDEDVGVDSGALVAGGLGEGLGAHFSVVFVASWWFGVFDMVRVRWEWWTTLGVDSPDMSAHIYI